MLYFDPKPFKVDIANEEQELLLKKLQLARLPIGDCESTWGEDNGITVGFMQTMIEYWLKEYDWASEQRKLNELLQFKVDIELEDWGTFGIHFIHALSSEKTGIPLIYLHGWPGNFTEVKQILGPLQSAGYHVVAPSLPGFGFSSYSTKPGFKNWHSAQLLHRLMIGLGYEQYVVAGGDWGAMIASSMVRLYPEHIQAVHLTNVFVKPPENSDKLDYSEFEQRSLSRMGWFQQGQAGYGQIQSTKPRTLGFALHDSPVGMLAWMADKILMWSDDYPWTEDEIITWTLLHYFPGPTTAFQMYFENLSLATAGEIPPGTERYVKVPTGVSAFAQEVFMVPRSWAERDFNIVIWQQSPKGGHFPGYEQPQVLSSDIDKFFKTQWKR
ncbi:alpha/beta-hydrolase [Karstenula rhodostoma CBS 690.94]|uniref:Alpha/beta-hydrolase n=1 Tax=Karstenula rhodostoma CBS 690.94 TaxID=1392251 RepID=A0A9P4PN21_9PLEO|nr:alpha/beta-hydrolase [Karstenula rhodostoma CBS 690.94]